MELRKEYRKASMAIVLILDRSGSMAMPVAGGKSKMDLANMASAKVVEMMASTDEVGVIAVDVAPHVIVNLKAVTNKQSIRNKVLRIQSQGGGIYVYAGLEQGVAMLSKSKANARHMISKNGNGWGIFEISDFNGQMEFRLFGEDFRLT